MGNKKTSFVVAGLIVLSLAVLFAWPRINNPNKGLLAKIKSSGLECMNGHARALQHFHPHLTIIVDGAAHTVAANVGIVGSCMAEIHTHDASGTLHVESALVSKQFRLKDFFSVWGQPLERDSYVTLVTVGGQPAPEAGDLILQDKQEIAVEYKRVVVN